MKSKLIDIRNHCISKLYYMCTLYLSVYLFNNESIIMNMCLHALKDR